MAFYSNGVPSRICHGTATYASTATTPTSHRSQQQNASDISSLNGGNPNANRQRIGNRGQNNRHARGNRRESIQTPATQRRPREPRANNSYRTEPYPASGRVFNPTSTPLEEPRRGRRGQMRLAEESHDIDMLDAPSLKPPEPEDIIMRDAPIPRRVCRDQERRPLNVEAIIQQFQRCKMYQMRRDKDNDIIMGEAPPWCIKRQHHEHQQPAFAV